MPVRCKYGTCKTKYIKALMFQCKHCKKYYCTAHRSICKCHGKLEEEQKQRDQNMARWKEYIKNQKRFDEEAKKIREEEQTPTPLPPKINLNKKEEEDNSVYNPCWRWLYNLM